MMKREYPTHDALLIMKLATPTHEEQWYFRNFVMQPKVANHPYRKMEQKWLPFLPKNL
jgi:hypothetical protein